MALKWKSLVPTFLKEIFRSLKRKKRQAALLNQQQSGQGLTKEELKESEKPLNTWLNDERYNLLMNRFGISEKKKAKNPGPYKTGMKKGYDDDGDGVPNRADKKPHDGSKK
jgi:hypothetical protein